MRKTSILLSLVLLLTPFTIDGQEDNRILLKVGENSVTAAEFTRLYTKSNVYEDQSSFDEYFAQFITFRLKVAQAMDEGLDTLESFRAEFSGYRNQLAAKYLTDADEREKLLRELYTRMLTETNAWHILVAIPGGATPDDTLTAYNKCLELRARLLEGESFEQVARGGSDDPSVVANGGNLGYFTAMQMILPFEDAAYSLKTGSISMPVRTPYGYHIIKVTGRRPSRGMIRAAHIMKAVPQGASEDAWKKAEEEIGAIYQKISEGTSFEELARTASDHRESATNGGELAWFGTGDIVHEFADAAFELKNDGDISTPVKTIYGWHIIKRLERRPIGTFGEYREMIESRLSNGRINSAARSAFVARLKKEYNFRLETEKLNSIIELTDSLIARSLTRFDRQTIPSGILYSYKGGRMSCAAFTAEIEANISSFSPQNTRELINTLINNRVSDDLITYEESRLEEKYPDFRYLMKEFHDGMLLFEISSREVWNRPYTDSTGLLQFYKENTGLFMSEPSAEITVYSLKTPSGIKKLSKLVRKYGSRTDGHPKILSGYISGTDTSLIITSDRYYLGENSELDPFIQDKGTRTANYKGMESVIDVTKTYPGEPFAPSQVASELAAAYQDYLEQTWIEQLKKKYAVWVDNELLQEIREKYYEKR
jgi:peptidyl-prolyl cis-trans isomerase SurA